jgi:hypothetical protein
MGDVSANSVLLVDDDPFICTYCEARVPYLIESAEPA